MNLPSLEQSTAETYLEIFFTNPENIELKKKVLALLKELMCDEDLIKYLENSISFYDDYLIETVKCKEQSQAIKLLVANNIVNGAIKTVNNKNQISIYTVNSDFVGMMIRLKLEDQINTMFKNYPGRFAEALTAHIGEAPISFLLDAKIYDIGLPIHQINLINSAWTLWCNTNYDKNSVIGL
jgi:hypothetical protein